ncbi:MAG: thioredoxin-disulfide reductase [Deltaproteobacteria bacterium]|nr:thioredoxin-disulfide reductase [Deltaproteobacteria bacterium]
MSQAENIHDVVIVGGGPAGLAAGIYTGRGGLDAVLLDMMGGGGQVNTIDRVENYPGVVDPESGIELADIMRKQSESFGVAITFDEVKKIETTDELLTVNCTSENYSAKTLLAASGASHRPLGVPGEGRLTGRGVSYCATCDGAFFRGQHVAVVGGGSSAVMEAVYLSRIVERVTLIHRRDSLRAEKIQQDRLFAADNIEVLWDCAVEEVLGNNEVSGLKIKNLKTGDPSQLDVTGMFVFIGLIPNSTFLKGVVEMDDFGFIKTDTRMRTINPRIFAAGDIRQDSARQIGTAVGDGITAAVNIQEMLDTVTPDRQYVKS